MFMRIVSVIGLVSFAGADGDSGAVDAGAADAGGVEAGGELGVVLHPVRPSAISMHRATASDRTLRVFFISALS